MAVIRGDWWAQAGRPIVKDAEDVGTADLATCCITSEKISAAPLTRSVIAVVGNPVSSDAGFTSCTQVWRPLVDVSVQRIQHISITAYVTASSGESITLFSDGSSMASVTLTTGSLIAGTRTAASTLDTAYIAACTDLTAKYFSSTGAVPGIGAFQIDFTTTG